jgi:hypothetical protein
MVKLQQKDDPFYGEIVIVEINNFYNEERSSLWL